MSRDMPGANAAGTSAWRRTLTLVALAAVADASAASTTLIAELRDRPNRMSMGCGGLVTADLDADGTKELYEAGPSGSIGRIGNHVVSRVGPIAQDRLRRGTPFAPELGHVQIFGIQAPRGYAGLFLVTDNLPFGFGVEALAGDPLRSEFSRSGQWFARPEIFGVGNIVSPAEFRFVVGAFGAMDSYLSGQTEALYRYIHSGNLQAVVAVQADGDTQVEWVTNGPDGLVLVDSISGVVDGTLGVPPMRRLGVGNFDADPFEEVVGLAADGRVHMIDVSPFEPRWTSDAGGFDMLVADRDNDGRDDVLLNLDNTQLRWLDSNGSVAHTGPAEPRFIGRIGAADVTGDGFAEAIYTSGGNCGEGLVVRSTDLQAELVRETPELGPFDDFRIVDLDADGDLEIVNLALVPPGDSFPEPRKVRVLELASGEQEWQALYPVGGSSTSVYETFDVGQLDGDPALEIALFGRLATQNFGYGVTIVDGATRQVQREQVLALLPSEAVRLARIADADGDGDVEFVVVTRGTDSTFFDHYLRLIDVTTLQSTGAGFLLERGSPTSLKMAQLDADAALEATIVYSFTGAFVYDTQSGARQFALAGEARDIGLGPGPAPTWLGVLEPRRIQRLSLATGQLLTPIPLTFEANAFTTDPLDSSHLIVAGKDRLYSVATATGTVEGSTHDLSDNLAKTPVITRLASNNDVTWFAGSNVGTWAIRFTRELFADGFE